ncbi:MAG: hypothetical protein PHT07_04795 [Paludibacter sp.]|nr:hypothetical protein [Paludibacter sp.]
MNDTIIIDNLETKFKDCVLRKLIDTEEDNIIRIISRFNSLGYYSLALLSEAVEIKKNEKTSYLLLLNLQTTFKGTKIPQNETIISEYEIIGLAFLNKNYGKVLIRPETIEDKINDLFSHIDIDFDFDKDFSKKYCVLANNEALLRLNISKQFIETINENNDLEIEIDDNILIVRLRKQFTPENGEIIAKFITGINNGRN